MSSTRVYPRNAIPSYTLGPLEQDPVLYPWILASRSLLFGQNPDFQTLPHGLESHLGFKSLFGKRSHSLLTCPLNDISYSTLGPLEQDPVLYPWCLESRPLPFGWNTDFQTLPHGSNSRLEFKSYFGKRSHFFTHLPFEWDPVFFSWTLEMGSHPLPLEHRIRILSFWLASCHSNTVSWVGFLVGFQIPFWDKLLFLTHLPFK